jgi:hypothetical protein
MDAAGLTILLTELRADCAVAADAARTAAARVAEQTPGALEACAYEVGRFYNILEKMLERVCEAFENHLETRGDYHEKLLQRMALDLADLRPDFIPSKYLPDIRELKGFRHLMRHAYDLVLRADRLIELAGIAERISQQLPIWCAKLEKKYVTARVGDDVLTQLI